MKQILSFGILVLLVFIAFLAGMWVAQKLYGGPHTILKGEAYGFRIGMTKNEVFETYKALNESANISAISTNKLSGGQNVFYPRQLQWSSDFASSDYWMGYRRRFPIYYQEFFFREGKLTNITTYIRFYEL